MTGSNLWDNLSDRIAKQVNRIAFARKVYLRVEDREDLQQEALLAVYLALERQNRVLQAEEVIRLTTTIAVRKRTDALRRLYRRKQDIEDSENRMAGEPTGHESDPAGQVQRLALENYLQQHLNEEQFVLMTLLKDEASYEEIAELLSRKLNTVKSDIRRLRQRCETLRQDWNAG